MTPEDVVRKLNKLSRRLCYISEELAELAVDLQVELEKVPQPLVLVPFWDYKAQQGPAEDGK